MIGLVSVIRVDTYAELVLMPSTFRVVMWIGLAGFVGGACLKKTADQFCLAVHLASSFLGGFAL